MILTLNPAVLTDLAVYLRFSDDDGKDGDSSSIIGQKLLIESFCKQHGLKIKKFYIDDGYTGSNFERPAFKEMINDIENKRVNCVITKDLSRLGRDYIGMGFYLETFFPSKKIRYIAIHDDYDSLKPNQIGPIKNMFNDWYAEDIRTKIKAVFAEKANQGQFFSCTPPYGYIKDPANKNHLIPDPEVAPIVKEIFAMTLNGLNRTQIAKILTDRRILVPGAYLKIFKSNTKRRPNWEYSWHRDIIQKILANQVYIGDMVNRKSEIINRKTKETVFYTKDSNERIIVENTHEALISREDFERIQTTMKFYNRTPNNRENFFKGLIFCTECNHRMQSGGKATKESPAIYYCSYRKKYKLCNHKATIKYEILKEIVTTKIRDLFSSIQNDDSIATILQTKNQIANNKDKIQLEKNKIINRLNTLSKLTKKVYEDFVSETINVETYKELIDDYQSEQKSLKVRLEEIELKLQKEVSHASNINKFKDIVKEFINFENLTQEMVSKIINRIKVSPPEIRDGKKIRDIKVYFNYLDELA